MPTGIPDVARALVSLNDMAATVPRDAPWQADRAEEWDGQTFETWKLANAASPGGRFLLDLGIESVWAAEPRDVSLLHVLFYIACAGNESHPGDFNRLISTEGGAQESRFRGGSQLISQRLHKRLGKRVLLKTPVRRIVQSKTGVQVISDHVTVKAKRVIVTGPPALTAQIDYSPKLTASRAQLTQRFPQGSAIKCMAVYDTPFWREDGLTGYANSDGGPVRLTYDNSPPDGSPGVLLGFIEGQQARRWGGRSARARRAAVIKNFVELFGARAAKPKRFIEQNWAAEEWTRGCYVGFTPPGVLLDYGPAIRRPVGRIHWAGAEMATIWNGYMDGAVRSGQQTAKEVLGELVEPGDRVPDGDVAADDLEALADRAGLVEHGFDDRGDVGARDLAARHRGGGFDAAHSRVVGQPARPDDREVQAGVHQRRVGVALGLEVDGEDVVVALGRGRVGGPHRADHHVARDAGLLGRVHQLDRAVAVERALALGAGVRARAGGEHDRVGALDLRRERVGVLGLEVGDHGLGAGGAHVGLVVGVADEGAHAVAPFGETAGQEQCDLPVAAGDDDVHVLRLPA